MIPSPNLTNAQYPVLAMSVLLSIKQVDTSSPVARAACIPACLGHAPGTAYLASTSDPLPKQSYQCKMPFVAAGMSGSNACGASCSTHA